VKVRLKNKGSQRRKRGRKRPKYQALQPEHPDTPQNIDERAIHANHLEAFASALKRMEDESRRMKSEEQGSFQPSSLSLHPSREDDWPVTSARATPMPKIARLYRAG
jgi:hypothetical protein